jgi:RHS repeat-associated protein
MTKMTNWSNFATTNGARVTTWTNNQYRGWLDSKHYDGTNAGPVYSYTDAGRLQNRLWARGTNTTYSYNNAGDLATVMYDDGLTLGITNGYDRRGRLISIINGPSTCSLAYDDAGNLQTESYSGGVLDLVSIQNIYDDFLRRKTNITKYNGSNLTIVTNNYDTGGRLSLIGDGTNSATYSYLANSPLVSQILFQQNGSNRMTMKQGFDNLNRLTGITNANPSSVTLDKHTYAYNSANQRTAVTQTDNSVWSFGYDALGQVTSGRKYWGDSSPVAGQQFGYTFDDIGNRTQTQVGGNELGLGLRSANYSANSLNQYESRSVPGAVDILGSANSSAIVTVNGTSTSRHGDYFRSEVGIDNGTGAAFQSVTAKAVVGGATNLLSTVSGNVYVPQNPEYFSYDADGNLTQDGRWTFTWDAENRLIKMTSLNSATMASKYKLDFAYDYFGRRIQKLVSTNNGSYIPLYTNRFVYDGWNLIDELNPAGGISRSYIWGLDLSGSQKGAGGVGGLLVVNAAASSQFTCFDGNGNVAALVDVSTSGLTGQYEYGPFGETIGVSGSTASANPIRFSSKYNETEAETINYGHRIYATQSGRWLSRDILDEPGFLASRRLRRLAASYAHDSYFFARNSPIATIDALGLSDRDVQNFKEAFWKLFDKMCKTKECCPERGWVQNLPFSGNLGCTKQTEKVQDMLAEIYKDKSKWDDLWEWNGVYDQTGPHNYSIMASGNPKDPVIKLDTWKGCLITYTMDSDETRPLKQWKDWLGETFDHDHFLYIKKKECFTCAERAKNKAK